jgi:hypothetical protein
MPSRMACLLAQMWRICAIRHSMCPVQEAAHGAHVVFDLQSLLTAICLKAGEHQF